MIRNRASWFLFLCALTLFGCASAQSEPRKVGERFRDCPECPELVVIPAGSFIMGSEKGSSRERPAKKVTIPRRLAIGRYETIFDEWDACHAAGGCAKNAYDRDWGRGRRPVINITYADIQQYLGWISKRTGQTYRLPSEAEWEYAARAGTTTKYWWGDKFFKGRVNCQRCGTKWSGKKSAPIGTFAANPWGLYETAGNIFEYVSDCWHKTHEATPTDGSPYVDAKCASRILKGGAWYYKSRLARPAARARNDVRISGYFIGFRVIRELP